jgi:hypothetical protein
MKIVVHQYEMENGGVVAKMVIELGFVMKRLNDDYDGLGLMVVIIYEFVMMMMTLYVNQVELE